MKLLTAHNLQKYVPGMSLSQNLQGRSSWSKNFQLYFKKYDFCKKFEIWDNFVKN